MQQGSESRDRNAVEMQAWTSAIWMVVSVSFYCVSRNGSLSMLKLQEVGAEALQFLA